MNANVNEKSASDVANVICRQTLETYPAARDASDVQSRGRVVMNVHDAKLASASTAMSAIHGTTDPFVAASTVARVEPHAPRTSVITMTTDRNATMTSALS